MFPQWNQVQSTTGFTTIGTRAVDPWTRSDGFDIDEDRRVLLREFMEKMLEGIDRYYENLRAGIDRAFGAMKEKSLEKEQELEPMELPGENEPQFSMEDLKEEKPELESMEILELIHEKKQQILPHEFAAYGAAKPMAFQSEEIPTDEQFTLSSSVDGLDRSSSDGKFNSYDRDTKGEQSWRHEGFNWEVNREVEWSRADKVTASWMFDHGIMEGRLNDVSDVLLEMESKEHTPFQKMNFSLILLHVPSKSLRRMCGSGRLNKWQWKRMHKKARKKEKCLLNQEKQLYHAIVRSEMQAKVVAAKNPSFRTRNFDRDQSNYSPITSKENIKALDDRFMREGVQDLGNQNNGPLKILTGKGKVIGKPINLWKLIAERSNFHGSSGDSLLYATRNIKGIQIKNEDQRRGVEIIDNALKAPTFTVFSNAGEDATLVIAKLLEQNDQNLGYNDAKGQYIHNPRHIEFQVLVYENDETLCSTVGSGKWRLIADFYVSFDTHDALVFACIALRLIREVKGVFSSMFNSERDLDFFMLNKVFLMHEKCGMMIDMAHVFVEKVSGDKMERVYILSALAEVDLEGEDVDTSLSDYLKALSILERLVELYNAPLSVHQLTGDADECMVLDYCKTTTKIPSFLSSFTPIQLNFSPKFVLAPRGNKNINTKESTIGAAFFSQTLVNDATIKFEIWDTIGEDKYYSLAPMYCKGGAAAIIVHYMTTYASFDQARKWGQELQAQGNPNMVMVLAGNYLVLKIPLMILGDKDRYNAGQLLWTGLSNKWA